MPLVPPVMRVRLALSLSMMVTMRSTRLSPMLVGSNEQSMV
jgi:hypothetical protein